MKVEQDFVLHRVKDPSLVLYLPLGQLDGAVFRSKDKHGHACTVTGALWTPQGRKFDVTDDYISIVNPAALNFGTGDFSVVCWFKVSQATESLLVQKEKRRGYAADAGFSLSVQASPKCGLFHVADGTNYRQIGVPGDTYRDGNWHQFIGTWNGATDTITLDADGQDLGLTPLGTGAVGSISNTVNFELGRDQNDGTPQFYLAGVEGEVILHNRAFPFPERQRIYQATKWRYQ